jgi:hypothetical protein
MRIGVWPYTADAASTAPLRHKKSRLVCLISTVHPFIAALSLERVDADIMCRLTRTPPFAPSTDANQSSTVNNDATRSATWWGRDYG